MRTIPKKNSKITTLITNHIRDNLKLYIIISLFLLIGIVLGVIFVNSMTETQNEEVKTYITEFTNSLKNGSKIDNIELLKNSVINNLILVFLMWLVGSTVIGVPIVIGIVVIRGFCLGYTLSAILVTFSLGKGILFFTTTMLLQNIIFLPCLVALAVSGLKLYKSIMKDRCKENIKIEIFRHTIFCLIILTVLAVESFVEAYISNNLLLLCIQYF